MSSKKDEKAQAAAERIKAQALTAAKGLSRAQAERAATAAARNVNAYGQKEEGPSRWQERKEAKRQMYLMSTEKAVRLGERKDLKANVSSVGVASQCQKCFQPGHWTYECKNERVYISRPSRSQILKNPKLRQKMIDSYITDNPDIEVKEEKEDKVEKRGKKSKRKARSDTESDSGSETSASESDSGSSSASGSDYTSDESASSYSSSSDSEEERKRRKKKKSKTQKKKSHRRHSSSSESSDYDSSSGSESEEKSRKKSKKHSRRR